MYFYKNERLVVIIDGPSLGAATRTLDFEIDFRKLAEFFRNSAQLQRMYFFASVPEGDQASTLRPLIDWLDYNNYTVIEKIAKTFTDSSGVKRFRGSFTVDLAMEVVTIAPTVDHVVLISGNKDYVALVSYLQGLARRVTVVSTLADRYVDSELRRQADQFIDLSELRDKIERRSDAGPGGRLRATG